ncbi:MAG: hypothetical protein AAGF26_09950 [Cyanobacteria bacterium P01_G01_bin.49]
MSTFNKLSKLRTAGTLTLLCGILVGIPLIPTKTPAQTTTSPNCPRLYYEEPWEDLLEPPVGCPPNQEVLSGETTDSTSDAYTTPPTAQSPPLPETRSEILTKIEPYRGQVEVILDNKTNSPVSYQVLGDTAERQLEGGEQVVLRNIPVPATITMYREDGGLLQVMPMPASEDWAESNNLHVTLNEDPTLDDTKGVLRIQEDGNVLLN